LKQNLAQEEKLKNKYQKQKQNYKGTANSRRAAIIAWVCILTWSKLSLSIVSVSYQREKKKNVRSSGDDKNKNKNYKNKHTL